MVVAEDRSGLVHDVAEVLRQLPVEVEGASQATLGGCSALSLIVSSTSEIDRQELQRRLSSVKGLSCDQAVFTPLPWHRKSTPALNYSRWNLYGTAPDQVGVLHNIAMILARSGGFIVRFLSLVVDECECVIDLTVALPSASTIGLIVAELSDTYSGVFGGQLKSFSQFRPQGERSLSWLATKQATFSGARLLSIVGPAKNGLVASITGNLAEGGYSISGSSMDVLRGHIVAMFAVRGTPSDESILEAIRPTVREYGVQGSVCEPPLASSQQGIGTVCFVSLLAPRGEQVLSAASHAFKELGANIERLRADLTADPNGTFSIDVFLSLPLGITANNVAVALLNEPVEWLVAPDPTILPTDVPLDLIG